MPSSHGGYSGRSTAQNQAATLGHPTTTTLASASSAPLGPKSKVQLAGDIRVVPLASTSMVRARTEGQGKRRIYREVRPVKSLEPSPSLFVLSRIFRYGVEEGPQDDPSPVRDKTASVILSRAVRGEVTLSALEARSVLPDRVGARGPTRARGSPASVPSPPSWSSSSSSSIKQCSGAMSVGLDQPRRGKCCPIDKNTSKNGSGVSHRTQSCSRSQRCPRANGSIVNFFYAFLFSLVFCVPVLQHLPTLGKGSGRERERQTRAIGIYLDTFSAYIRKPCCYF